MHVVTGIVRYRNSLSISGFWKHVFALAIGTTVNISVPEEMLSSLYLNILNILLEGLVTFLVEFITSAHQYLDNNYIDLIHSGTTNRVVS